MHVASKLHQMCSTLQQQNYLKYIRAFMLKLEDASHYMVFVKVLNNKLKTKALSVLKQKWLLSKMQNSLIQKREKDLQKMALMALRTHMFERINLRDTVEQ